MEYNWISSIAYGCLVFLTQHMFSINLQIEWDFPFSMIAVYVYKYKLKFE